MNHDDPREAADESRPEVFLSYSRRDKDRVRELVTQLRAAGLDVWIDETGIELSTRWSQEIVEGITGAKVFLLIATRDSLASPNVAREISLASEEKKPLFPVFLEECEIPASVRYELAGVQHLQLFGENEADGFQRLVTALREAVGKVSQPAGTEAPKPTKKASGKRAALIGLTSTVLLAATLFVTGVFERESVASAPVPLYVEPEKQHKTVHPKLLLVRKVTTEDGEEAVPLEFEMDEGCTAFYFVPGGSAAGKEVELPARAAGETIDYEEALPFPRGTMVRVELLGKNDLVLAADEFELVPDAGKHYVDASLEIPRD